MSRLLPVIFIAILSPFPTMTIAQVKSLKVQKPTNVNFKDARIRIAPSSIDIKRKQIDLEFHSVDVDEIIKKVAGETRMLELTEQRSELRVPAADEISKTNIWTDQEKIIFNTKSVATGGVTSTVCEPSIAMSASGCVLVTGNWFASFSTDEGRVFEFINPAEAFPEDGYEFCCDQVAHYSKAKDTMIWFLQYSVPSSGGTDNIFRIAVAAGDDIKNQNWKFFDFRPTDFDPEWIKQWFDYPDIALNDDNLFLTTNMFKIKSEGGDFTRAVIVRIPLNELKQDGELNAQYFATDEGFSLRPTQGAGKTMFFGAHDFSNFESKIQLYSWNDGENEVKTHSLDVDPWLNKDNERVSKDKDGNNWLKRADFRMTGAWFVNNRAGFTWCAADDSQRLNPHLRVAIIDTGDIIPMVVAQPHIWHDVYAFAYPAVSVNFSGKVGISVCYGGGGAGGKNPSHAVGYLDDNDRWVLTEVTEGTHGPLGQKWGDYLGIRPHNSKANSWISAGYSLQQGNQASNVEVHTAEFRPAVEVLSDSRKKESISKMLERVTKIEKDLAKLRRAIEDLEK